jgi:RNA polymerase sigma-70 factor (ECF subfamily)
MALDNIDFEKLYNQYSVLVYNLALNYLQNIEDAEEITQDVFIQINNSLDKFQEKSSYFCYFVIFGHFDDILHTVQD